MNGLLVQHADILLLLAIQDHSLGRIHNFPIVKNPFRLCFIKYPQVQERGEATGDGHEN